MLDIGAGTGRHSLVLQERGLEVVALDIAPQVGEIMTKLGVRNVVCGDIFDFDRGTYDTLLLLLHGIGMVGDLQGLARFLNHIRGPTRPGGVLLLDSLDVRCSTGPVNLAYQERNRKQNRYIGEIRMAFEYKGRAGPMLSWLQVDPDMMHEVAIETGGTCEILHQDPWGDYLARLSP